MAAFTGIRIKLGHNKNLQTPESELDQLSWKKLEETKSKLAHVIEVAGIMSAFSVTAAVEIQINKKDVNPPLLTAFSITTSILVGLTTLSILISVCILPHIQSITRSKYYDHEFIGYTTSTSSALQISRPLPLHDKFLKIIEISCFCTNSICIFLFIIDLILIIWIKFAYYSLAASIAGTILMIPILAMLIILAIIFYRDFVKLHYQIGEEKIKELERMQKRIDRLANYHPTTRSHHQQQHPHSHSHSPSVTPVYSIFSINSSQSQDLKAQTMTV